MIKDNKLWKKLPEKISDTDRIDFLEAQNITKWVGYSFKNGNETAPVFPKQNLRKAIDYFIEKSKRGEND